MHNSEAIFRARIVDFSTAFFVVSLSKTKYFYVIWNDIRSPNIMKFLVLTKTRQIKNMLYSKKHNIIMPQIWNIVLLLFNLS